MLSIIIPTFNEENYLPKVLESIDKQSFRDYEIIVADHHSTDGTVSLAKEYGAIITTGGMPGKGRNQGAQIAKGELLLFLDADVILDDAEFLARCVEEFQKLDFGVATCYIKPLSHLSRDKWGHRVYNWIMELVKRVFPFAPGSCIFIWRHLHQQINGFDETVLLGEDSDYVKRASKLAKFGILKSFPILVSVRRLDRDGRLNVLAKYVLSAIYSVVIGPVRSNIFRYTFGYPKKK